MAHDPKLLDAIEALPVAVWEGEAFRYTSGGRPPDKENIDGARWNPRDVPTVYTALSRETAVAEFNHHLDLWTPRPTRLNFTLYELRIRVREIIDVRPHLALLSLTEDAFSGDDYAPCQAIGHAAWWLQRGGLLVPSARLPGEGNLVIFTDKQSGDWLELVSATSIP